MNNTEISLFPKPDIIVNATGMLDEQLRHCGAELFCPEGWSSSYLLRTELNGVKSQVSMLRFSI